MDRPLTPILTFLSTAGVFVFFGAILLAPRAYSAGAAILLLGGLIALGARYAKVLRPQDKILIALMAGMFAIGLFSYVYHQNPLRELDLPSRYMLAIPVLILLLACPPRREWMWAGLITGSIGAATIAGWELVALNEPRAMGSTGVIQFGNTALMMGTFCVAGIFEVRRYRYGTLWTIACVAGALAGAYASLSSGSRGGWIALPSIFIVFVCAFINRRNAKYAIGVAAAVLVALTVSVLTIPTIESRYEQAISDIQQYEAGQPHTSLGLRIEMYRSLGAMIPEKPWFGWSTADYAAEQQRLVAEKYVSPVILDMANTHNTFLELWVLQGCFSVLLVVALLGWALFGFLRLIRHDDVFIQVPAVCGASLVVGYTIFSQSQVMLGRNNTLIFFLVSLVLWWSLCAAAGNARRVTNR